MRLVFFNFFLHLGLYHQKANYRRFVLALNWCRSHQVIPLVGCRSKSQATDTLASLDWQLKQEERDLLDSLWDRAQPRYNAIMERHLRLPTAEKDMNDSSGMTKEDRDLAVRKFLQHLLHSMCPHRQ